MPLDKWQWSPSPLLYQVLLVTTRDENGEIDVAPKSCATIVAFAGPTFGFGCQWSHRTAKNIRATGEFVVNVPGAGLAEAIWAMPDAPDRLAAAGLTTLPGTTVSVPVIAECVAHLECVLDRIIEFPSDEVFILGTVRRIDMDERCLVPDDTAERYRALNRPLFFLEPGWCAPLGQPTKVGA